MNNPPLRRRTVTTAQRGQIIQRVIVDGWTSATVAASFDVPQRVVDIWVADFRRNGMASLHRNAHKTIVPEFVQRAVLRPVQWMLGKMSIGQRRFFAIDPLVEPLPLRRSSKDTPGFAGPG